MSTPAPQKRFPLRFTNDPALAGVLAELEGGREVVAQFSAPVFDDSTLDRLNAWSARFGRALQVRFFGFHEPVFDCAVLARLPDVAHLEVDSMPRVHNPAAMQALPNLQALRIGIDAGVPDDFLQAPAFARLRSLILSGDTRKKLDLAPVRDMVELEELHVKGYTRGLEHLAGHPALRKLSLSAIGHKQSIAFVSALPKLTRLMLILGGRSDLCELRVPTLETLELIRVQGLADVDLAGLPGLQKLDIANQPRLARLDVGAALGLAEVGITACPALATIDGLAGLPALASLHLYQTGIDFDALLATNVRPSDHFNFYGQSARQDREIHARLAALGYATP